MSLKVPDLTKYPSNKGKGLVLRFGAEEISEINNSGTQSVWTFYRRIWALSFGLSAVKDFLERKMLTIETCDG